jgi:protein ECT2
MYNDIHLPETDAWAAVTRDLRQSKESRNALSKENSYVPAIIPNLLLDGSLLYSCTRQLKRRMTELESEKEEYVSLVFFWFNTPMWCSLS